MKLGGIAWIVLLESLKHFCYSLKLWLTKKTEDQIKIEFLLRNNSGNKFLKKSLNGMYKIQTETGKQIKTFIEKLFEFFDIKFTISLLEKAFKHISSLRHLIQLCLHLRPAYESWDRQTTKTVSNSNGRKKLSCCKKIKKHTHFITINILILLGALVFSCFRCTHSLLDIERCPCIFTWNFK